MERNTDREAAAALQPLVSFHDDCDYLHALWRILWVFPAGIVHGVYYRYAVDAPFYHQALRYFAAFIWDNFNDLDRHFGRRPRGADQRGVPQRICLAQDARRR